MRKSIKALIAGSAAVAIIGLTGASWAWFTENSVAQANGGTGGTIADLTVTSSTYDYQDDLTALYPGDYASVVLTINNPNAVPMYIQDIASAGKSATGGTPTECAGANLVLAADPAFTTNVADNVIPANGSANVVLTNAVFLDGPGTPNTCQGMTFSTSWTVSFENR